MTAMGTTIWTSRSSRRHAAAGILALLVSGCAVVERSGPARTTEIPRVQDCALVSASSPSKFVCKGTIYTSFELAKLREGTEHLAR
jgi:hypothetical protein